MTTTGASWLQRLRDDERGFIGTTTAMLVAAGVGAAGQIVGAHKQQKTSEQALAYEKELDRYRLATEANRYAALREGVEPYVQTGGAADARMAALLGLPAPGPSTAPPPRYPTPPLPGEPAPRAPRRTGALSRIIDVQRARADATGQSGAPPGAPGATPPPGPAPTGAMRLMQAPDGTLQHVPESEREYWEARGARSVN